VNNFYGMEQGGSVGEDLALVGDAKYNSDFFVSLTECTTNSSSLPSTGGVWAAPLQPTEGALTAFFSFVVEPCDGFFPNGSIALVFQDEGFRALPMKGPQTIGVALVFFVMITLNSDNSSSLVIGNTDCNTNIEAANLLTFSTTGVVSLYSINSVELQASSQAGYYYVIVNDVVIGQDFNGANYNILQTNNAVVYYGLVAYAGSAGNTQFAAMSLGLDTCVCMNCNKLSLA